MTSLQLFQRSFSKLSAIHFTEEWDFTQIFRLVKSWWLILTDENSLVTQKILKAMVTRRFNDIKQNRESTQLLAECNRLGEAAGENIATGKSSDVDALYKRLVPFWLNKKSFLTNEECTAFMLLNNITAEDIDRFQSPPATQQDIEEAKAAVITMWDGMKGPRLKL